MRRYTEEDVERSYEDFYEDVHTEFLKFGEIINFKVCRNASFHLRGNVYVHYKSLDSAVMAYRSAHGRYFAGKQVKCEFVSVTRWKVAICGEYMKSRLKTCSRGSACNFLHCFSNPGGDYEWADCDKPPPRYWVNKMTALFGYSDEIDQLSPNDQQHSTRIFTSDRDSYYKRHRSVDQSQQNRSSSRSHREETHTRKSRRREHRKDDKVHEDETEYKNNHQETDSDEEQSYKNRHGDRLENHSTRVRRKSKSRNNHRRTTASYDSRSDEDLYTYAYTKRKSQQRKNNSESSNDAKTEPGEGSLVEHKQQKIKSTRRRSRGKDRDEVDREFTKDGRRSRHRAERSRSRDSVDINDTSDRWQPHNEL